MSGGMSTGEKEIFQEMINEFEITFVQELVPGILHNFANPLNGIMGRSRLLQRRVEKSFENINYEGNIDDEILGERKKIVHDIDLIINESDRLFNLFNDVTGKLQRLRDIAVRKINLSELIETEMAFFNFYLDFRHNIHKELKLDRQIPEVTGSTADYSIALSAIIRHAANSMKDSQLKKLIISTYCDATHVCVKIENTGINADVDQEKELPENRNAVNGSFLERNENNELFNALSLLKKYDALFQLEDGVEFNTISVRIPY